MYYLQTMHLVAVLLLTLLTSQIAKGDLIVVKPPVGDPTFKFLPDLTVTDVARPIHQGNSYVVDVTVKNIGRAMSYPSYVLVRDNYTGNGKMTLLNTLNPGQSQTVRVVTSGPEEQPNIYISAIADYGNKVR